MGRQPDRDGRQNPDREPQAQGPTASWDASLRLLLVEFSTAASPEGGPPIADKVTRFLRENDYSPLVNKEGGLEMNLTPPTTAVVRDIADFGGVGRHWQIRGNSLHQRTRLLGRHHRLCRAGGRQSVQRRLAWRGLPDGSRRLRRPILQSSLLSAVAEYRRSSGLAPKHEHRAERDQGEARALRRAERLVEIDPGEKRRTR